jgi:hypothetical protein
MKKWILFLVLLILLGCTYKQRDWYKPGMMEVELKKDSYECEKETLNTGYSWVRSDSFFRRCMESKGYKVKD